MKGPNLMKGMLVFPRFQPTSPTVLCYERTISSMDVFYSDLTLETLSLKMLWTIN